VPLSSAARSCLLASIFAAAGGGCVATQGDTAAGRASALATTVSRAVACRAGTPPRTTLERFVAAEQARGTSEADLAAARSAYVTVSEAETINQGIRPQPCTAEERAALRARMGEIRAGRFEAP